VSRPTEIRTAPNIYQCVDEDGRHVGWRVYVRRPDPKTGRSQKSAIRFKPSVTLDELLHFRDAHKLEAKRQRRQRRRTAAVAVSTFADDAAKYLALATVKAMPSFRTREIEITTWVGIFGSRPRHSITAPMIDEALQRLKNDGYSGSTVNKFRTALMSLWTRLDGRSAANPVKDTAMFDEAALIARAQPYDLLTQILDSIPAERGRGVKGEEGSRSRGSESRARLEVLAWTGMDPSQLAGTKFNVRERWYVTPQRQKGSRRSRTPRPEIRKPMSPEAAKAFKRFEALGLRGKKFSTHSLRHTWERGIARVQKRLREELDDPTFTLPHIRLKDIRHSFGTRLYQRTQSLDAVGKMLDHAPGSPMTLRYSLGAVPSVLKTHMRKFGGRKRAS
jgi:integrase